MKKMHTLFIIATLVFSVSATTFVSSSIVKAEDTPAAERKPSGGGGASSCGSAKDCILVGSDIQTGAGKTSLPALIKQITDILLFAIGLIAVIMLIIGGIRYTVSGGDSSAIASAKNTILYAIIGIVVAILAYAIVNFIVGSFT